MVVSACEPATYEWCHHRRSPVLCAASAVQLCHRALWQRHPLLLALVLALIVTAMLRGRARPVPSVVRISSRSRQLARPVLSVAGALVCGAALSAAWSPLERWFHPPSAADRLCVSSSSVWWWCDVVEHGVASGAYRVNSPAEKHEGGPDAEHWALRAERMLDFEVAIAAGARRGARLTLLAETLTVRHGSTVRAAARLLRPGGGRHALEPGGAPETIRVQLRCLHSGAATPRINISYVDERGARGALGFRIPVECDGTHLEASEPAESVEPNELVSPRFDLHRCAWLRPHDEAWHRLALPPPPPQQQHQQRQKRRRGVPVRLPIWFALPSLNNFRAAGAPQPCRTARIGFAPMLPGRGETYRFASEHAYYAQYAGALFGVTLKKAGMDCLRHYEILAAGAVPYFLGLDELERRPLTMLPFPRQLVRAAMQLRGVPPEEEVRRALWAAEPPRIDWANFDWGGYCAIRSKLLRHTAAQLTTASLARYFLHQLHGVGVARPRLLFVSSTDVEYQSGTLYHGLRGVLGARMSAWLGARAAARKRILYRDHARDDGYGGGFSYQATLRTPALVQACGERRAEALLEELTDARLEAGYFNVIVVTTAANGCCNMSRCYGGARAVINGYLQRWPATVVATVDGNDDLTPWKLGGLSGLHGCHTSFEGQLPRVDLHFVREVHEGGAPDGPHVCDGAVCTGQTLRPVQRPRGWDAGDHERVEAHGGSGGGDDVVARAGPPRLRAETQDQEVAGPRLTGTTKGAGNASAKH